MDSLKHLTNKELIKMLQKLPPDAIVTMTDNDSYNANIRLYIGNICIIEQDKTDYNNNGLFYNE